MKTALVLGAGGFIGSHMVKRLRADGYWVRGVDLKYPEFSETEANEFVCMDLTDREVMRRVIRYGGERGNFYRSIVDKSLNHLMRYINLMHSRWCGFIFTGDNDADIMQFCTCILNLLEEQRKWNEDKGTNHTKIFYSSSACMYPEHNQLDPDNPDCVNHQHTQQTQNMDGRNSSPSVYTFLIIVIIIFLYVADTITSIEKAHGKVVEKRHLQSVEKLQMLADEDSIEVWGDGEQTRSFLYIDECIEATRTHGFGLANPINIGSEEMVTINQLVDILQRLWKEDNQRSCR